MTDCEKIDSCDTMEHMSSLTKFCGSLFTGASQDAEEVS